MSPMLPAELTDYTIDFLQDDVLALRACALVCRAWLPRSRCHLFHTINIADSNKLTLFAELTKPSTPSAQALVPYVRALSISERSRIQGKSLAVNVAWGPDVPGALSTHLSALRALHLDSFLSFWQPASFALLSYARFASVDSLTLTSCSLRSFYDFQALICTLPRITSLHLEQVTFGVTPSSRTFPSVEHDTTPVGADEVALTSLRVDASSKSLQALFNWLLATPSVSTLRHAQFTVEEDDIQPISAFVHALDASLTHLTLTFSDGAARNVCKLDTGLTLAHNTALTSLRLLPCLSPPQTASPVCSVPMILARLNPPHIHSLSLPLAPESMAECDWHKLDDFLSRTRSLTQLSVSSLGPSSNVPVEFGWKMLRDSLPKFARRGGVIRCE